MTQLRNRELPLHAGNECRGVDIRVVESFDVRQRKADSMRVDAAEAVLRAGRRRETEIESLDVERAVPTDTVPLADE